MVETLKDGKKMISLGSGTVLLIGGDEKNIYICNTGESPLDTNDTIILSHTEINKLVLTLLDVKNTIQNRKAA